MRTIALIAVIMMGAMFVAPAGAQTPPAIGDTCPDAYTGSLYCSPSTGKLADPCQAGFQWNGSTCVPNAATTQSSCGSGHTMISTGAGFACVRNAGTCYTERVATAYEWAPAGITRLVDGGWRTVLPDNSWVYAGLARALVAHAEAQGWTSVSDLPENITFRPADYGFAGRVRSGSRVSLSDINHQPTVSSDFLTRVESAYRTQTRCD